MTLFKTFANLIARASKKALFLFRSPFQKTKTVEEVISPSDQILTRESLERFSNCSPAVFTGSITLGEDVVIRSFGLTFDSWLIHFWIQKLPFPELSKRKFTHTSDDLKNLYLENLSLSQEKSEISLIALNFDFPSPENYQEWLTELRSQEMIWDPNPIRVSFMNSIGLSAYLLDPSQISNGWLQQSRAVDTRHWEKFLGLGEPSKSNIVVLGYAGSIWDRALASEFSTHNFRNMDEPFIEYLPGWHELIIDNVLDSFSQAGWINLADCKAANLVFININDFFNESFTKNLFTINLHTMNTPITPDELRLSLKNEVLYANYDERLKSSFDNIFSWNSKANSEVSVVISLYNYEDRILNALESIYLQTQENIELIVVNDCSQDDGPNLVKNWMENIILQDQHPFSRLLLLSHHENKGLAAARNTAFQASLSPWCFVLDADNQLFPEALSACYELASLGSSQLAVVHPLLLVESEPGREDDQRSLVGLASWQKSRLMKENTIDAMALVRRSAWNSVGGYTHIEGGWEDYDFWCKLIDKGFYGIQCPKILAVYRSHDKSMSHSFTNVSWRSIARTLKKRHPWMTPRVLE